MTDDQKISIKNYINAKNLADHLITMLSCLPAEKVKEILFQINLAYCGQCGKPHTSCCCYFYYDEIFPPRLDEKIDEKLTENNDKTV